MAIIRKTGIGPFGRTIVEANGQTRAFAKSSDINDGPHGLCVTEHKFLGDATTCFLGSGRGIAGYGDRTIVGGSKSVEITRMDGGTHRYESQILGVNRVERRGSDIIVVQHGLFGDKEIGRHRAADVATVKSDECNVCREVNPLYGSAK